LLHFGANPSLKNSKGLLPVQIKSNSHSTSQMKEIRNLLSPDLDTKSSSSHPLKNPQNLKNGGKTSSSSSFTSPKRPRQRQLSTSRAAKPVVRAPVNKGYSRQSVQHGRSRDDGDSRADIDTEIDQSPELIQLKKAKRALDVGQCSPKPPYIYIYIYIYLFSLCSSTRILVHFH